MIERWVNVVKEEYDFSDSEKNPYTEKKEQITINVDAQTLAYFKEQAAASGIPYQTLINLYLVNCASRHRKLSVSWK